MFPSLFHKKELPFLAEPFISLPLPAYRLLLSFVNPTILSEKQNNYPELMPTHGIYQHRSSGIIILQELCLLILLWKEAL